MSDRPPKSRINKKPTNKINSGSLTGASL